MSRALRFSIFDDSRFTIAGTGIADGLEITITLKSLGASSVDDGIDNSRSTRSTIHRRLAI